MKYIKPIIYTVICSTLAILAPMQAAHAQTSKNKTPPVSQMSSKAIDKQQIKLQMSAKDFQQVRTEQQKSVVKNIRGKIENAAKRQGVRVSSRDLDEASQKIAKVLTSYLFTRDITEDLSVTASKISIGIKIKLYPRPMKITLEITL